MPTESLETRTTPETAEQRIERLERENNELRAENEKLKTKADQGSLKEEIVLNRLYRFGKSKLDKAEVDDILKNLNGEYKNKIEDFIKNDKIEDLQKYLNGLIDSGAIDKDQLVKNCKEKGIRLKNGHIFEDGKFGPQTFEAIKGLSGSENGLKKAEKDRLNADKENIDYDEIVEGRDKKLYKVKKLANLDDLPEDYKWAIPSNYENGKEETYATVYHVIIKSKSEKPYIFYGNGTCRSPLDDQIYDSKDIVEKLRNKGGEEEIENDRKDEKNENLEVIAGNTYEYLLKNAESIVKGVDKACYIYSTMPINPKFRVNYGNYYYKDFNFHDFLDDKGVFDNEKLKKSVKSRLDKEQQERKRKHDLELKEQEEKNKTLNEMSNFVRGIRGKTYKYEEIFGKKEESASVKEKAFFNRFTGNALKIDNNQRYTYYDVEKDLLYFSFDFPGFSDPDRLDFAISRKEIINSKGKVDETKFKNILKSSIEKIVKEHF